MRRAGRKRLEKNWVDVAIATCGINHWKYLSLVLSLLQLSVCVISVSLAGENPTECVEKLLQFPGQNLIL